MIRVYVAGPIRANTPELMFENIQKGIRTSLRLIAKGMAPYCPFLDYNYLLMNYHGAEKINIQMLQDYSKEWLRASEAVLVLPGSAWSSGVKAEIEEAKKHKIPIYHTEESLIHAIGRWNE